MNTRLAILLLTGAGLGGLVWMDRAQDEAPSAAAPFEIALLPTGSDRPERRPNDGQPWSHNPLASLPRASLTATVERPLFTPGRRPPRIVVPRPVVRATPKPVKRARQNHFRLIGVIRSEIGTFALLSDKRDGRSFRVERGDQIDGWTVRDVGTNDVALVHADQVVKLSLSSASPHP